MSMVSDRTPRAINRALIILGVAALLGGLLSMQWRQVLLHALLL